MERTLTLQSDQGEVFAVLKKVKEDETLLSIRQRVSETTGCDDYSFQMFGISLKPKQERNTFVRDCSQKNCDGGLLLTVKTNKKTHKVINTTSSSTNPGDGAMSVGSKKSSSPSETVASASSGNRDEVRGLNSFSEAEIEAAQGLFAKERMRFHNVQLEKLKRNETLSSWGHQELLGVIETSWVMKKTELLKLKVKEILSEDISSTTDCKGRDKAVMRNLESVEKATFDVNAEYARFSDEVVKNETHRPALEARFDAFFSALKKSQANLLKSIEAFLKSREASVSDQCESQTPVVTLGEDEVSILANDVKTEYESD